jgi:hypothetical protein
MDDDNSETSASETMQTVDGEISNPQFGASAVYPSQSGVSGVYPTQSGSSAAYPPAKKSPHGAVSQTQPGRCSTMSPQPGDEVSSNAGKYIALVSL